MQPEPSKFGFQTIQNRVERYQRERFHERYVGASLSKLEIPSWAAERIVSYMKCPKNMLIFHGDPGIGKTYFCAALTDWALTAFDTRRYHKEEKVLICLRQGISEGKGDYLRHLEDLIDDELVILDDVGSGINPKKFTQRDLEFRREVFYSFLDYRYNNMKPTIITSNFTKDEFKEVYSERIMSRLFAKENTIISIFNEIPDKRSLGM